MTTNQEQIATLLKSYENALNASDTGVVMKHYAADAVFMPQHSPSSIGIDAITDAYAAVFKAIKLQVKFDIAEIVPVAQDWAFARTNSSGTVTINTTGSGGPEANQELFVFQKLAGDWKIARYCFSTTNTPPA